LKTANLEANQQTWTKAERDAYNDFGIYLTDIVQRELFLVEKGNREMIHTMHAAGLPMPQIATISGKTEDELRRMIAGKVG
jgi:hypothetical protein